MGVLKKINQKINQAYQPVNIIKFKQANDYSNTIDNVIIAKATKSIFYQWILEFFGRPYDPNLICLLSFEPHGIAIMPVDKITGKFMHLNQFIESSNIKTISNRKIDDENDLIYLRTKKQSYRFKINHQAFQKAYQITNTKNLSKLIQPYQKTNH